MLRVLTILCLATASLGTPLTGAPRLDGRIVGGQDATIEEFPYQLSLEIAGNQECGAIILSERWALTAAQCVGGSTLGMRLHAGTATRNAPSDEGTVHTIMKKIVHPNFNITTVDFDIALLEVTPYFEFDDTTIGPINLIGDEPVKDDPVTAVGWGNTHSGGLPAGTLQKVEVSIVDPVECQASYDPAVITDNMICAGTADGGLDACQGDSGGPLVVKASGPDEKDLLVGIVSWGRGCALAAYPGVYTKVSAFLDWISANTS